VSLPGSFVDPSHEIAIRERFAERLPGLPCTCSHEVSPEIRGFERTSTTVLNVLLMPVVQRYVAGLLARTRQAGLAAPLYLVQCNGGAASPAQAGQAPVNLLLSGPSGGVLAAQKVAPPLAATASWLSTWAARATTSPSSRMVAARLSRRAILMGFLCACPWLTCAPSARAAAL